MKSDKELIQLILNNIYLLTSGLCILNVDLLCADKITLSEYNKIKKILIINLPNRPDNHFCWALGAKKPRIKFLKQLIEKL